MLGKDLQPKDTSVELTGLPLKSGIRYYTVVQAYNFAGLHTTESSDGFMLDLAAPIPGVVFDGKGILCKLNSFSKLQHWQVDAIITS